MEVSLIVLGEEMAKRWLVCMRIAYCSLLPPFGGRRAAIDKGDGGKANKRIKKCCFLI